MLNLNNNNNKKGALTSKPYAFQSRPWEIDKINYFDFFSAELTNLKVQLNNVSYLTSKIHPTLKVFAIPKNYLSNKIRFILNSVFVQKLVFPYFNSKILISWKKTFKLLRKNLFQLIYPILLLNNNFSNLKYNFNIKNLSFFRQITLKYHNFLNKNNNFLNFYNYDKNLKNETEKQIFVILNLNLRFDNPKFF